MMSLLRDGSIEEGEVATYVDVLYREIPKNGYPEAYITLHDKFIEVMVLCQPVMRNYIEEKLSFWLSPKDWNKKYPKILKILEQKRVIPDYSTSYRSSGVMNHEMEGQLEELLRARMFSIHILEQNRTEGVWMQ